METRAKFAVFPTAWNPAPRPLRAVCDGVAVARPCLFCAIVRGEIPASFVLREDAASAFLDGRPVFKGHVLVVPPRHVEDFHALTAEEMGPFWSAVQRVSRAVEAALEAQGTFI